MRIKITHIPKAEVGLKTPVPLAELEKGEIYESTEGSIKKIDESGNTHENGGEIVDDVSRVLEDTSDKRNNYNSKVLKLSPKEIEDATGVKVDKPMTHSKAFEKVSEYYSKKSRKLEKNIKKNLNSATKWNSIFAKNSMEINSNQLESMPTDKVLFDTLFNLQETKKAEAGIGQEYTDTEIPMGAYGMNANFSKGLESSVNYAKSLPKDGSIQNPVVEDKFNEPLRWFDLVMPLKTMIDSRRRAPTNYFQTESFQIQPRLQSAAPYLQQAQGDFNAALNALPDSSIGYANAANLFAQKYKLDNQTIGQIENQNQSILNQYDQTEAARRNQQSINDVNARANFEDRWLTSLANQQEQFNTGIDSFTTRVAQNRKLNREGDLIMQMYQFFNDKGQYNGKQFELRPGTSTNVEVPIIRQKFDRFGKAISVGMSADGKRVMPLIRR